MKKMTLQKRVAVTARGFRILRQYCPGMVQGRAFYELIHSLQPFVTIWFSARIIDEIVSRQRIRVLAAYVVGIIGTNFICAVCKSMLRRVTDEKENEMWNWFGKIFADKQMNLDFEDLENVKIQCQRQEAEEDLNMFGNGLAQLVWGTPVLVRVFVNIAVSFGMAGGIFFARSQNVMLNNPIWVFLILLCVFLGGYSNFKAITKENEVFAEWCKDAVWFNRTFMFFGKELHMNLERAKDVRIYQQNNVAEHVLNRLIETDKESKGNDAKMSLYPALSCVVIGVANAVCYLYVVMKSFFGAFGVGSIVQYVAVLARLGDGIQELMYLLSDNKVYCEHLQKLYDYLDIPSHMYQGALTVEKREDNEYDVEFRDVSFRYPNTQQDVLQHVNMKFKVGEKLAVVGMNGSGKTTFIKLLCRLYDPTEGEILLNGVDIRKYDYQEYMSLFSVVFQDFKLFSFGLGQNVAAGREYDKEQAALCLEKAGFGKRLAQMQSGLDTCLYKDFEENGVEISGGEAQKIALARALYKNAPFIVLDEPTAALDPVAEYEVYAKFNEIVEDKTAIYISHRLSSCRFCDTIAVFDQGKIIQCSNHDELIKEERGKYYELWHAQAQYYVERKGNVLYNIEKGKRKEEQQGDI